MTAVRADDHIHHSLFASLPSRGVREPHEIAIFYGNGHAFIPPPLYGINDFVFSHLTLLSEFPDGKPLIALSYVETPYVRHHT